MNGNERAGTPEMLIGPDEAPRAGAPFGICRACGMRLSVVGAADDPSPEDPFRRRVALRCMRCGTQAEQVYHPAR